MSDWTDEMVTYAIARRKEGRSFTEVAKMIGRNFPVKPTRNAVIGKFHRMGIKQAGPAEPAEAKPAPRPKKQAVRLSRPAVPFKGAQPTGAEAERIALENIAKGQAALIRAGQITVESPNARPFLEAPAFDVCKWPIGEGLAMLSCCNRVARGSYCEGHAALAYDGRISDRRTRSGIFFGSRTDVEQQAVYFTRFERDDAYVGLKKARTERPATPWDEARVA